MKKRNKIFLTTLLGMSMILMVGCKILIQQPYRIRIKKQNLIRQQNQRKKRSHKMKTNQPLQLVR